LAWSGVFCRPFDVRRGSANSIAPSFDFKKARTKASLCNSNPLLSTPREEYFHGQVGTKDHPAHLQNYKMTDLKKSDDHIQNREVHDKPKPLVAPDASAVRNASGTEFVDARKGNNQDGSAWLDKDIPKPVDYKSIRLV
jgi:hypothetical protein